MTPADYISELFAPSDRIAIVLISRTQDRVIQRIMDASDASSDRWQRYFRFMNVRPDVRENSGRPFDVFVSMNRLKPEAHGRTKADIAEVRHLFLDIDENGPAVMEKLLARKDIPAPHSVMTSSPGHFQPIWRVEGFSLSQAETWARNMVRQFGADPARIDVSSVMRLPGFRNQKYAELNHYVSIQEISKTAVERPGSFPAELLHEGDMRTLENVRRIDQHPRNGGNDGGVDQNREDAKFALRNLRNGMAPDELARRINEHRLTHGGKRKAPDYGERTVRWAQKIIARDTVERKR